MLRRRLLLAAAGAVALLAAGCDKLAPASSKGPAFNSTDITGADYGRALALPDVDGKPRTMADFKGKVTVVFFGFTQCPEICPTTMAELAEAKKKLGPDGARVQGVFITVDPERDTPEILKSYVTAFDPGFTALRGTPEQTQAAAKDFKVYYEKSEGKTSGSYTINHTTGSYVFDESGKLRLFTRHKLGVAALTADLKALMASPA
jgi:protein SCO1